jgi:UDPglucose 6-dehydrogenase
MRVAVVGLWHLGCVTAACLARAGHEVVAIDSNADVVSELRAGNPPLFEPGLQDAIREGLIAGKLRVDGDVASASSAEIVWVALDTPLDENDRPQPSSVLDYVSSLIDAVAPHGLILISSQLPVGSTRRLCNEAVRRGRGDVTFAYSPENLRLGRAIELFMRPDRVVIGLQSGGDRKRVAALFAPLTSNIVWMGIEAAEMTKHAINAFLATSVAFMNELGALCEQVGADAREVERGLKTEERIGPRAYLSPGAAFAGGTLARDVETLTELDAALGLPGVLIAAVRESNHRHRAWPLRKLKERLGPLAGRHIAILGLTYKAGTSTLRRSSAVELAMQLLAEGAQVTAFDPAVKELPARLAGQMELAASPADALRKADAVVLATGWPEFHDLSWPNLLSLMRTPIVIDANWFMAVHLRNFPGIAYTAVGLPWTAN